MVKILIGGSPCTFWSIAQKNNRETEPTGIGWELFENYLMAKEKFKPDIFLYENNKSAAQPLKDEIRKRLNVWDGTLFMEDSGIRYIEINSALVSAQKRQRFYVHNFGEVQQPEDRGIILRDILEPTTGEQGYCTLQLGKKYAEPICHTIQQQVRVRKHTCDIEKFQDTLRSSKNLSNKEIAEKLNRHITEVEHWFRKDKYFSVPEPDIWFELKRLLNIETTEFDDFVTVFEEKDGVFEKANRCYDVTGKMSTFMTNCNDKIIEPIRIGDIGSQAQAHRVYSCDGKSVTINAGGGGQGGKTGLYVCPVTGKTNQPIYEVKDGLITIKGKQYSIKLADGFYIIRKLTVKECCRLQTMPDDYCRAVSDAQAYKGLGNGWTAEVVIHILSNALKDIPKDEEIVVLSMYDGIGTGRYCLDKMGFTNIKYYAYEIDKYAKQVAMSNYPDIIQCGDAYQVRNDDWKLL